jgi:hypothetical protein
MKSLSLCQKLGAFFLLLAVCVLAVGCGGSNVDALVKEQKELVQELMNSKGDPEKLKAAQAKQEAHAQKVKALSEAQQKEYAEKVAKEIFGDALKGLKP